MKVVIICPSCARSGKIDVEENVIRNSNRGVTTVTVGKHLICDHSFIAYIDKNLSIRDCFITDFQIELPQMQFGQAEIIFPSDDQIDIYLISINMSSISLAYIIRSCFHKESILYINELPSINEHLIHFFDFIFRDLFEFDINFSTINDYRKNKKQYKDQLVLDANKVMKFTPSCRNKLMTLKKMKIEQTITHKFYSESNPKISLILLKNEIKTVYELCKRIIELNNNLKENEFLNSKKIIDYLNITSNVNLQIPYLTFLEGVIESYFSIKLKKEDAVADFLMLHNKSLKRSMKFKKQ